MTHPERFMAERFEQNRHGIFRATVGYSGQIIHLLCQQPADAEKLEEKVVKQDYVVNLTALQDLSVKN